MKTFFLNSEPKPIAPVELRKQPIIPASNEHKAIIIILVPNCPTASIDPEGIAISMISAITLGMFTSNMTSIINATGAKMIKGRYFFVHAIIFFILFL